MEDELTTQEWEIEVNEPVQIENKTLLNTTPSQTQPGVLDDVEVEFSRGDKQIQGSITAVAVHDFLFKIVPVLALDEAGEWDLEIKGLTDDVGNAQDTLKYKVNINPVKVSPNEPIIDWVDAHVEDTKFDANYAHIHVKFNNNMQIGGSSYSVERTENWNIDGYDLPEGSSIVKGIPFLPSF